MDKRNLNTLVFFGVMIIAAVGLVLGLMEREPEPLTFPDMEGVIVESPPTPMPDFKMTDQDGKPFTTADYLGKWSLVFFGYTNCPDFCPTSMVGLQRVSQKENMPETQYVFHTVDPDRDDVATMKDFIEFFGEDFVAVTGDKSEIDKFAAPLGVIYDLENETDKKDYVVNHYGALYIIDPKARLRAYLLPPHEPKRISEVYLKVREYYGD
jgi:protein SCO1/2